MEDTLSHLCLCTPWRDGGSINRIPSTALGGRQDILLTILTEYDGGFLEPLEDSHSVEIIRNTFGTTSTPILMMTFLLQWLNFLERPTKLLNLAVEADRDRTREFRICHIYRSP